MMLIMISIYYSSAMAVFALFLLILVISRLFAPTTSILGMEATQEHDAFMLQQIKLYDTPRSHLLNESIATEYLLPASENSTQLTKPAILPSPRIEEPPLPSLEISLGEPEFEAPASISDPELKQRLIEARLKLERHFYDLSSIRFDWRFTNKVEKGYVEYQQDILKIYQDHLIHSSGPYHESLLRSEIKNSDFHRQKYVGQSATPFNKLSLSSCVVASALNACVALKKYPDHITLDELEDESIRYLYELYRSGYDDIAYERSTGYLGLFAAAHVVNWMSQKYNYGIYASPAPFNIVDVVAKSLKGHKFVYGKGHARAIIGVRISGSDFARFDVVDPLGPSLYTVGAKNIIEQLGYADAIMVEIASTAKP